jgi:hypothetical protein
MSEPEGELATDLSAEVALIEKVTGVKCLVVPEKVYADKLIRRFHGPIKNVLRFMTVDSSLGTMEGLSHFEDMSALVQGPDYPRKRNGVTLQVTKDGISPASIHETAHLINEQISNGLLSEKDKMQIHSAEQIVRWIWAEGIAESVTIKTSEYIRTECVSQLSAMGFETKELVNELKRMEEPFYGQIEQESCVRFLEILIEEESKDNHSGLNHKLENIFGGNGMWMNLVFTTGVLYVSTRIKGGDSVEDIMKNTPRNAREILDKISESTN